MYQGRLLAHIKTYTVLKNDGEGFLWSYNLLACENLCQAFLYYDNCVQWFNIR